MNRAGNQHHRRPRRSVFRLRPGWSAGSAKRCWISGTVQVLQRAASAMVAAMKGRPSADYSSRRECGHSPSPGSGNTPPPSQSMTVRSAPIGWPNSSGAGTYDSRPARADRQCERSLVHSIAAVQRGLARANTSGFHPLQHISNPVLVLANAVHPPCQYRHVDFRSPVSKEEHRSTARTAPTRGVGRRGSKDATAASPSEHLQNEETGRM